MNVGTQPEDTHRNAATWQCLTWILENLEGLWSKNYNLGISLWEFQLALAVEFVKLTGQLDVCPPKRVLALIGVHDILANLESNVPRRGN